ncbi:uncharacterized protein ELE39_002358 [Cryptosporidium sp. chipmunk genotype I]|uniref:uncharacterized protein n=1 Tax=Cryptosporidium sp. chipmunk genotype I TaxID=1280935 RepID=UPI00351A9F41|nr:transmembrane protein [Cryptosporidium sp. chipmunk genotype I]
MNTLFLSKTPKEQKRDDLNLINTLSKDGTKKNLSFLEETNLLIKIQNAKIENYEEHLDYIESENQSFLNGCLNGTPIRKRYKEHSFSQSNKLLTTPKKYFGEDILNTVPKNTVIFTNSVDRSSLNKQSNIILGNTSQKTKIRCSMIKIKPPCNNQNRSFKPEFSCTNISMKSTNKNFKKWFIYLFNTFYDFVIYQLPLALILYSFALYLLSYL